MSGSWQGGSSPEATLVGRRFGRYEVLTTVAKGGMATVYVARALGVAGFERLVAIKVLHPHMAHEDEFVSMFLDEARLAARIRNPNVVATLDISDSEGDGFFIVMDYIEGDHLGALLRESKKREERVVPPVACRIILDSLSGLAAAHALTDENGENMMLVHRDVSPHNIIVGTDGVARLTDFGIAKADVRLSSTREGQFKGKVAYMSPQQAKYGAADQRADLFSLGVVFWETLVGRRLFLGETNADTLYRILEEPVPPPSSIYADLAPFDEVALKALARPLEERYQSADEFAGALEKAAAAVGGVATARQVAEVVRDRLGEKVKAEAARIKDAITLVGHAHVSDSSHPSLRSSVEPRSKDGLGEVSDPTSVTATATPGARSQPGTARKRGLLIGAFIAFAALMVGTLVFALGSPSDGASVTPAATPAAALTETAARSPETAPPETAPPETAPNENAKPAGSAVAIDDLPTEKTDGAAEVAASPKPAAKPAAPNRSPATKPAPKPSRGSDLVDNPYRR